VPYEAFASAIRTVAALAPARSPRPLLQNIRLTASKKKVEMRATDLEVGAICEIVEASVEGETDLLLSAQRLTGIVREATGESVELIIEGERARVLIGGGRFVLQGAEAAEFPEVTAFGERKAFEIEAGELASAIGRVAFAAAREGTRYAINGVFFSGKGKDIELAGTDGRRLARMQRRISAGPAAKAEGILSVKFLSELQKLAAELGEGTVKLAITENQALAKVGTVTLSGVMIEGRFPAYMEVIPKEKGKAAVMDRAAFEAALRQAKVLTTEETRAVSMSFSAGKVKLRSQTPEVGEAEVEMAAEFKGNPLTIAFNPDYLMDVLRAIGGEKVSLELLDSARPGVIREGEGPNTYTYVVMPVKLRG